MRDVAPSVNARYKPYDVTKSTPANAQAFLGLSSFFLFRAAITASIARGIAEITNQDPTLFKALIYKVRATGTITRLDMTTTTMTFPNALTTEYHTIHFFFDLSCD